MSAARAVLWDMDGTLIDSENLHWVSWRNVKHLAADVEAPSLDRSDPYAFETPAAKGA